MCLGLAGCAGGARPWDTFSVGFLTNPQTSRDRVIAGSVDDVSLATQSLLRRLNLQAKVTEEYGTVRIASATRSGRSFTLVLTKEMQDQLEYTRVSIEWSDSAEDETGYAILSGIQPPSGN